MRNKPSKKTAKP
uniref:Uncharacterized protein n=1 Tax=Rhizophora mucronata TaxID=61149 RepID=A0A2P2IYE0_RHIMU